MFAPGHAVYNRSDGARTTQLEIAVAPQDDVEVRRLRITNRSGARRDFVVTSYAEIVLAPPATDAAHPAFSKLFLQTEIVREQQAILCTRRPRAPEEPAPWWFHLLTCSHPVSADLSYETDRMRFIGRGRSTADPQVLDDSAPLGGSAGAVLDAVAAIRCCLTLEAGESASVDMISGVSDTRYGCLGLVAQYQDRQIADRLLVDAPAHGRQMLDRLQISESDARLYACLAGPVIYAHAALRATPSVLVRNVQGQPGLWTHGISGDLPIVLLRIADPANLDLLRQLTQAHAYWRLHGLAVELVVLCDGEAVRQTALSEQAIALITAGAGTDRIDKPGGFFVRRADPMPEADRVLLQTVARVVLSDADGSLAQQLERCLSTSMPTPPATAVARVGH